jgi:hypothetical protein
MPAREDDPGRTAARSGSTGRFNNGNSGYGGA